MLGRLLNRGPLVAETTASELAREIHEGTSLQIVDVRELDEWHGGRIPGSIHIPLGQLEGHKALPTNKTLPLLLMCPSGARAGRAAALLRKAGYEKATAVAGGTGAWREASLPIEKGAATGADKGADKGAGKGAGKGS